VKNSFDEVQCDFAVFWAKELGQDPESLVRMKGGMNNSVYRCGKEGKFWIIKAYPSVGLRRDGMKAEVEFLRFASGRAPQYVPKLCRVDHQRRCLVLEYLSGDTPLENHIASNEEVSAAVDFYKRLNCRKDNVGDSISMNAADGYRRITQHIENTKKRIKSMDTSLVSIRKRNLVRTILHKIYDELEKQAKRVSEQINNGKLEDEINQELLRISPSDFGYHNAIKSKSSIHFIDFEFAGWDDPAKTVIDFWIQPRAIVNSTKSPMLRALRKDERQVLSERIVLLTPILYLKWVCIILGVLNPERLEKLKFADTEIIPELKVDEQIERMAKYILRIENTISTSYLKMLIATY